MRILFIGDIIGRSGREALAKHLPQLKEKLQPDVVIVNGENAAHGIGINEKIAREFFDLGVDCITTGNHVWDQREVIPYIQKEERLLRPINFPAGTPGNGSFLLTLQNGQKILIVNAMARLFMDALDDPFAAVNNLLQEYRLGENCQAIFVDFHGEATSEKMAFAHYIDGRVSGVVGTHTHIPTADTQVLEYGTAYQSDAGMTGDYDSVIGVRKDISIHRFIKKMPGEKMVPASGDASVCGSLIVTNDESGKALAIDRVCIGGRLKLALPEI